MPFLYVNMLELKKKNSIMETKKCSKCGRELPVSEFWKNASTEDGLQTYCKDCGNAYAKSRKKSPGGGVI